MQIWRTRLLDFGILESDIRSVGDGTFQIRVPISADTNLIQRMLQQSGRVTLHLFKDGAEVQALRQRIDTALEQRAAADTTGRPFDGGLSRWLASLSLDGEISDIVVKEENLTAVRTLLADSTVKRAIRAYNLANPPAGAFTWASEPVERDGQLFYPLYFINQDIDLNAQPLEDAQVDEASEVTAFRGAYAVRMILQEDGREGLANLSEANTGSRLAVKMDDEVHITFTIQGRIPDGRVEAPGGQTVDEARALSALLTTDILPVDVVVSDTKAIVAVNGDSSVQSGLTATAATILILGLFLIIAYRASGAVAAVGFLFHLIMTGAILRLWIFAGITPLLSQASLVAVLLSLLVSTFVHIWYFERLKSTITEESAVRQAVSVSFENVHPAILWLHVLLLMISIGFVVIGIEALANFGLAMFAGIGGSLLTFLLWTRTLLSAAVENWHLKKLSI